MKKFITVIFFSTLTLLAFGQEPDLSDKTITWNCANLTDSNSGNFVSQSSEIVTSTNGASWIQGGFEQTFTISGRDWNWNDGSGSIIYDVDFYGLAGELKIESDGSTTSITIYLDGGKENYQLEVSNYSY